MEQLTVSHIGKKYGRQTILDDLSFQLAPGKIYGLLGRNGAGKSTLLNIITGRVFPTSGTVTLGNLGANNRDQVLGQFYLMSESSLYPKRTTIQRMFDLADGSYGHFDYQNADRLLKTFGIDAKTQLSKLSTGLQTAAKLVVALNVNASYVFLDEPTLGLDANHRDLLYKELVHSYQERPRTFVLSTHLIDEIQQLVEHVLILANRQLVADADVQEMLDRAYTVTGPAQLVDQYVAGLRVLSAEQLGALKTAYVFDQLDEERVIPDQIKIGHYDLQRLFIGLTNGGSENE